MALHRAGRLAFWFSALLLAACSADSEDDPLTHGSTVSDTRPLKPEEGVRSGADSFLAAAPIDAHCARVCQKMAEAQCSGFAFEGCTEVCRYARNLFARACQSHLSAYFKCRARAPFHCDAEGLPVTEDCESVGVELDECMAVAPPY
jgi:hypothetical protein